MIEPNVLQNSPEQASVFEALARRVANGPQLRGSPKLREFFLYVVDCALREAPREATEQHIGVHVFHRSPGYNSGDDSIVRSHARLLRAKLSVYFATDGIDEPTLIEIPKGQYLPIFRPAHDMPEVIDLTPPERTSDFALAATAPLPSQATAGVSAAASQPPAEITSTHWSRLLLFSVAVALLVGGTVGYLWRGQVEHPATPSLDAFWKPFYASDNALVIYSNPAFTGDPTLGLQLITPSAPGNVGIDDGSNAVDETYTGTGEASAIHKLTQLFDAHGTSFTLKRSGLVTWDDARSRSLVLIGAPSQNTALNDLQALTQFRISKVTEHHGYILNSHPRPGEPAAFAIQTPDEETAIVALVAGLQADTRIAIFSGLSTIGTQGAVEFFCQSDTVRRLIAQVGTNHNGILNPFEAVLLIRKSKGVPIGASFVAIHAR